ncbi:hypothetical protein Ancab_014568 [Ancistrocladus abbreviatus]
MKTMCSAGVGLHIVRGCCSLLGGGKSWFGTRDGNQGCGIEKQMWLMWLKKLMVKLRRSMAFSHRVRPMLDDAIDEPGRAVKEGHFAVSAVQGDERRRFLVELRQLRNPALSSCWKMPERSMGRRLGRKGPCCCPCPPHQLQMILEEGMH